jgi:hypothetical protein
MSEASELALLGGFEVMSKIAGHDEFVADQSDLDDAESESGLPLFVVRMCVGHALGDGNAVAKGLQRGIEFALILEDVADLGIADGMSRCQPALSGSLAASLRSPARQVASRAEKPVAEMLRPDYALHLRRALHFRREFSMTRHNK